eukprot:NODE_527_length_6442_cov_0.831941.p5 type:complete len:168 gc:universal NODE_527_length_6442_cov_0.831941:4537-5040(+)
MSHGAIHVILFHLAAECTVLGVPSITTNLSGFGCYMDEMIHDCPEYGIFVMDRRLKSVEETINQMVDCMVKYCHFSRRERIQLRNRCERLSDLLDWKVMGKEYERARQLATKRFNAECGLDESEEESDNESSNSPLLQRIQSTTELGQLSRLKLDEEHADDIVVEYK